MCVGSNQFANFATLYIACSKHLPGGKTCLYKRSLNNLLKITSAKYFLSVYVDAGNSNKCSLSVVQQVLQLSRNQILTKNPEITVAVSPKNQSLISSLCNFEDVNRVCIRPIYLSHQENKNSELLLSIQKLCERFNNVAMDLVYDVDTGFDELKLFVSAAVNIGIKHVTLHESNYNQSTLKQKRIKCTLSREDKDVCSGGYDHYICLREFLLGLGFIQYELCNFAVRDKYKSIQNTSLWEGKQFIGIGANACSRVAKNSNKPFDRYAVTCHFMQSRCKLNISKLSKLAVLEELLMLGLRSTSGIKSSTWKLASGGASPLEDFANDDAVKTLILKGYLFINDDEMVLSRDKILVLDSILVILFQVLCKRY